MPVRFGRALFAAAPEPKEGWFPPEAGHNDLSRFGAFDAMMSSSSAAPLSRTGNDCPPGGFR